MGALNSQGIQFARKWGGNCKERNIQGKAPQFASVCICKEWIYPGNQEVEFTRNSICKERSLQGTELARNGGEICKEWLCKEQSHGTSPAMWDHTVLPATRRKWTCPALTPARKRVLDSPGGVEGWVDYPAMERPGIELATSRSQVRDPNHYTTEPPM